MRSTTVFFVFCFFFVLGDPGHNYCMYHYLKILANPKCHYYGIYSSRFATTTSSTTVSIATSTITAAKKHGSGSKKGTAMNLRNVRYPPVPCLCWYRGSSGENDLVRARLTQIVEESAQTN